MVRHARTKPGALLAVAVLGAAIGGASACREAAPRDRADRLIADWIEAAGGMEAWEQIHDARFTVVTVWFDSTEAEVRRRPRHIQMKRRPERARIERREPEGRYVQAHDGRTPWATLDGERLPASDRAAAEVPYVTSDVVYWFGLPYKLRDPGVSLEYIPADSIGYEGVRVSFGRGVGLHPGDRYFYYFDGGSPWPVQAHYVEEGSAHVNRTHWSDFRRAGPIAYVGTRTWVDEDGRRTKRLLMEDVVINPGIPDSTFQPPAR